MEVYQLTDEERRTLAMELSERADSLDDIIEAEGLATIQDDERERYITSVENLRSHIQWLETKILDNKADGLVEFIIEEATARFVDIGWDIRYGLDAEDDYGRQLLDDRRKELNRIIEKLETEDEDE